MKSNITKQDQREIEYERKGYWQPYTLGEHLRTWAQKYGDRIALVGQNRCISYNELDQNADELASGLKQLGIRRGDRILAQLPNQRS